MLVIGAGPPGLAAALAAADAGARDVVLVDENAQAGRQPGLQRAARPRRRGADARACWRTSRAHPRIRVLHGTVAAGYYADHWVPLVDAASA